jgi:hypothetical protein
LIGEYELCRVGVDPYPRNGDGEHIGNLAASRLGGLFTIPSSKLPFAKSTAAEAASVAEYIKYGFENWDGRQCSSIDPEHSASALALPAPVLQEGSCAMELKSRYPTWRADK